MRTIFYFSIAIKYKKSNRSISLWVLFMLTFLCITNVTLGQTTIFTDNFDSGNLAGSGSPNSLVLTPGINLFAGTGTAITEINGGNLAIYNSNISNSARAWVSGPLSTFISPFNTTLSSNLGDVTWYFNMQTSRTTVFDGFANGKYGSAVVLAATSSDFSSANGYAVVMYKGTTTNALRLVSFTGGLLNTNSTIIIGPSADFANNTYVQNIKVVYTPSINTWKFYSYDTGQASSTSSDPKTAAVVQVGNATVNNTYTSTPMSYFGFASCIGSNSAGTSNKMKYDVFSVIANPGIFTAPATLASFVSTVGTPVTQTISVGGNFLNANITAAISGTDAGQFSVSPSTLTQSGGTVGATTVTITYNPSTTGSHSATLTLSSSGAASKTYSMTGQGQPTTSTWSGTNNWSYASGWDYIPLSSSDIVVSNGELTVDQNSTVHSATVNSGAKLTLATGKSLTAGTFTLKSDVSGTGTFLDANPTGGLSVTGTTTVQQYLSSGRNWYISSPVTAATAAVFNPAGGSNKLYWYDETKGSVVSPATPWSLISSNSTGLTSTQGYVTNMAADGVVSFTGTLNNGSLPATTIYRSDIPSKAGFNLVGNPYPSYLDWDQLSAASTHLLTSIWQRTKTIDNVTYQFDTYNSSGKMYISNSGRTVNSHIPPMQAFWVRVDNGYNSGTLNFTNAMRSHKGSQDVGTVGSPNVINDPIFKSKTSNAVSQSVLRLQISNGTNTDETVIYSDPDALNSYDNYDSPKMFNSSASIAEIFTIAGSEQLAINGLNTIPYDTEMPLGFNTLTSGTYSIKASQFCNFDSGVKLILKDYIDINNPVITDLSNGNSYTFSSASTSNNTTRFVLIFGAPSFTTGINPENNNVWISTRNRQIVVNGTANKATLEVFNAVGQKVISKNLTGTNIQENNKLPVGAYFVKLTNEGKYITKKIIID